ncbi:MAG: carbohydrate kinase family protein [Patescibacteria group bacterium]
MKVICIGSTSKDIFFPTNEGQIIDTPEELTSAKKFVFELGAKYHINDRFESLGGCAANQSAGFSRLGIPVFCYTSIGDDSISEWIKDEFSKEGIGQDLINVENNCLSGLSAIVVDKKSADRIIFSNQEANERLEIIPEKIKNADFISVTDLSGNWKKVLDEIIKVGKENNIKIAYNPRGINIKEDSKKVSEIAGRSEIFFVNKDEAIEILFNLGIKTEGNEIDLIKKIKDFGLKVIVITDGSNGAWGFDGKSLIFAKATLEKAVDSTGAGDAFSSGFMAAYIKGKDLEECLRWGIANGGNVVNFYGGIEGLLKEEEMLEKIKRIEIEKIKV